MFKTPIAIVVAALTLTGCAFDEGTDPVGEESLYARLGTRATLVLEPTSLVGVVATDNNGNYLPCMQPTVTDGSAVLRSTKNGLLLVEDLDIHLSDISIPPGVVYSEPIELTNIRLHLGTQIALQPDWAAGNGLHTGGTGTADLLLDWSVRSDSGDVYALATQLLRDTEFLVEAGLQPDGSITAYVATSIEGRIGSFANRIQLRDFSMAVNASTDAAPVVD